MILSRGNVFPYSYMSEVMAKNYNVRMTSHGKSVTITIPDLDADFGPSSTGKTNKVAYGVVYYKDSRDRTVTVQLNAYAKK